METNTKKAEKMRVAEEAQKLYHELAREADRLPQQLAQAPREEEIAKVRAALDSGDVMGAAEAVRSKAGSDAQRAEDVKIKVWAAQIAATEARAAVHAEEHAELMAAEPALRERLKKAREALAVAEEEFGTAESLYHSNESRAEYQERQRHTLEEEAEEMLAAGPPAGQLGGTPSPMESAQVRTHGLRRPQR